MIDLYYWPTPNGWKISIMLEECGLPYRVVPVNIGQGDQFEPEFLAISPNNRMPAIVDPEGPEGRIAIFESGAILLYLAEKTDRYLPTDMAGRHEVIQWLMFQMGGIGPMLGQAHHFRLYAPEKIDYAFNRYTNEAARLYRVVDKRLSEHDYLAGDYSIADMATFPWLRYHENQGQKLEDYPHLKRWYDGLEARPAVQRGLAILEDAATPLDDKARAMLFGEQQYKQR